MFSPQVRHYFDGARGYGQLAEPTHQGLAGSVEHGHFFQLQLQLDSDGLIQGLAFYCPRCVPAIACGAYLYEQLLHASRSRADQLTPATVLAALGGLPVQRSFYAWLAVEALRQALSTRKEVDHA